MEVNINQLIKFGCYIAKPMSYNLFTGKVLGQYLGEENNVLYFKGVRRKTNITITRANFLKMKVYEDKYCGEALNHRFMKEARPDISYLTRGIEDGNGR